MFPDESQWIGDKLKGLCETSIKAQILNVGSSTRQFREEEQPHIYANIFEPMENSVQVDHLDIKKADGVDIIGDLTDVRFLDGIVKENYDIVICSNLLEHVPDPIAIINGLEACTRPSGYIIVTVPRLFPYHNDPIDTMFRPNVFELQNLFKKCSVVESITLRIRDNHFRMLFRKPKLMVLTILRLGSPFYKYAAWKKITSDIPNLFSNFEVSCIVLKKLEALPN